MRTTAPATHVLFEPFALGPLRLRNRLIMAPMGTCLDEGGHITDATIAYYRRRAEGGVGTITVEGCLVSPGTLGRSRTSRARSTCRVSNGWSTRCARTTSRSACS